MRDNTLKFIFIDVIFRIKLLIKQIIFSAKEKSFTILRRISLYLLTKVDPEFLTSKEMYSEGVKEVSKKNKKLERSSTVDSATQGPVLIDSNSLILGDAFFNYTLDSIVDSNSSKASIINFFKKNGLVSFASQMDLIDFIKKYYFEEVAQHPDKVLNTDFSKDLVSFSQFTADVKRNISAYVPKEKLNFDSVFWPDPTAKGRPRSIFDEFPFAYENKFISPETPVGSAGSCFAMEIAHFLQRQKFNYVVTEANQGKGYAVLQENPLPNSPAAWGTIFNTPSFRQLVERAFGVSKTPQIIYSEMISGKKKYFDAFREAVAFDSVEAYQENYELHLLAVRQALMQMKVFIITLGVNEIWYFRKDGSVISRFPNKIAPALIGHKVLSVEDNLRELSSFLKTLRTYNPDIQIIVSVSPIPLNATFLADRSHVITANCHSKATLRVVAEEFVRQNSGVHYLPSYETVMYTADSAWEADQRHVTRETVAKVVKLFNRMFVKDQ